jgi:sarcosine oxidase subunit gamma
MSDFRAIHRSALGARQAICGSSVTLSALAEGTVIHVLAHEFGNDMQPFLGKLAGEKPNAVRPLAPNQWLLVSDEPTPPAQMTALLEILQLRAIGVDQSHGRVRILVEGKNVERVLSKGTAVDLSLNEFAIGHSATTLIGHIASHLTRVGPDAFEIIVLRGFADSLWDDLARMSAEFG